MHTPQPLTSAFLINNILTNKVDAIDAFRSLETQHGLDIRLTHTGVEVRRRSVLGKPVVYSEGDYRTAKGGKAKGAKQCAMQRIYAVNMLHWASTKYPTPAVIETLARLTGGKH